MLTLAMLIESDGREDTRWAEEHTQHDVSLVSIKLKAIEMHPDGHAIDTI